MSYLELRPRARDTAPPDVRDDDHVLKGVRVSEKEARISDHYPLSAPFGLDGT